MQENEMLISNLIDNAREAEVYANKCQQEMAKAKEQAIEYWNRVYEAIQALGHTSRSPYFDASQMSAMFSKAIAETNMNGNYERMARERMKYD